MKSSGKIRKPLILFQSFSTEERNNFGKWLRSLCGHRPSEELKTFWILEEIDEQNNVDEALKKEFQIDEGQDGYLRAIYSRFLTKQKEFLAYQALKNYQFKDLMILEELNRRDIPEVFAPTYKQLEKKLEQNTDRSTSYFRKKFLLKSELQNHLVTHFPKSEEIPFAEAMEAFDDWWIHQKLRFACYIKDQAKLRKSKIESFLLEELIDFIKKKPRFKDKPALQVYIRIYEFQLNRDPNEIDEIAQLVRDNIQLFDSEEQHNLFTMVHNFYMELYKGNRTVESAIVLLEHIEWGMEAKILFSGKALSWDYFRNMIKISLQEDLIERATRYMEQWQGKLSTRHRKDFLPYLEGLIFFQKCKWGTVKNRLNRKFKHPIIEISARFIYFQALYEEGEWERKSFLRKCNSLEKFITSSQHPRIINNQETHLLRIHFFKELLYCEKPEHFKGLWNKLDKTAAIPGKEWLKTKIAACIGVQ